jgi:aldehyde dehydrogenase (NAD+)
LDVIDPATEEVFTSISAGSKEDVDRAVAAATKAFAKFSKTTMQERLELLKRIVAAYDRRRHDLAQALSQEMGAPTSLAEDSQVYLGYAHLTKMVEVLPKYKFQEDRGNLTVAREPIGVVGLITPWNWPLNQISAKIAPAIAAGCTMILKPSEIAPINAIIYAEILDEAGVPPGVFNLVNGDGPTVGEALARHPDVHMISFTGSTRAGVRVAQLGAETVKRVVQELGGKSANILLDDVDLSVAVRKGVEGCFLNSGQSCNAPTRMFVPFNRREEAAAIARETADAFVIKPTADSHLGPVVSQQQFDRIQALIQSGIDEGARLVTGGLGRPSAVNRGYYVRPTVFSDVLPSMRIFREEVFGPVLAITSYKTEADAIGMANDTDYGLAAAYVASKSKERAARVAAAMRAGNVYINYPAWNPDMPFGGYKRSGDGREYAEFGLDDFTEIKGIVRAAA